MPFKKDKVPKRALVMNGEALKRVAQSFAEEMLLIQVEVARDRRNPGHVRVDAAERVLSRAHGRPAQSLEVKRTEASLDGKSVADLKIAFLDKLARILGEQSPDVPLIEAESVEVEEGE